jgi:hypothetical protein
MIVDLAVMRAICVLYVPGTRSSGGVVMKKIGVTFVPGARTRTLRNQRKSWLRVLLFDALACTSATIIATGTTMLVLLLLHTMRSGRVPGRIRVRISR